MTITKKGLHSRNKHQNNYDFPQLIKSCPELAAHVFVNPYNTTTLDFANPDAVKMLNKALLMHFYGLSYWDIPPNYLCPPIPSRADYIHNMADLLAESNAGIIPTGVKIKVLDVGVGANCVYPLIGHKEYGWSFVGSDIDKKAIASAEKIIAENGLEKAIQCRLQTASSALFSGIIQPEETFDLVICNPPFHASMADFAAASNRKWQNLGKQKKKVAKPVQNFGGISSELCCEGGESAFVRKMVQQSADIPTRCVWFSALISKSTNLPDIYHTLDKVNAFDVRTMEMAQGQKTSRVVAWTFLQQKAEVSHFGNKK
jgi:23S rRNA (adenine1618-N6)-methyltransferase